jgi:hypothetical protein
MAERNGPERLYSQLLRDVASGKASAHPVELGKGLRTANRVALERVANYVAEPQGAGRKALFEYLERQKEEHQGDEALTSSHAAWYYNAWGALLFFTWKLRDEPAHAGALEWLARNLALENLLATPDVKEGSHVLAAGRVIAPGARCFLADGKTAETQMADQRKVRDLTRAVLIGARVKFPKAVETALDWTGLWFLRQLPSRVISQVALVAAQTELPRLSSELHVVRGRRGHLAWFVPPVKMLRPAYWAAFLDGQESYGCLPSWPKGFQSLEYPPDMPPMPEIPEGEATVVRRSIRRPKKGSAA